MSLQQDVFAHVLGNILDTHRSRYLQTRISKLEVNGEPSHGVDSDREQKEGYGDMHPEEGGLRVQVAEGGVTKLRGVTLQRALEVQWQDYAEREKGGDEDVGND